MEEYDQDEIDNYEDNISTSATTAETIEQLEQEIETLKSLKPAAAFYAQVLIQNGVSSIKF